MAALLIVAVLAAVLPRVAKAPSDKQVVTGQGCWAAFDLESATDEAVTIVYGSVSGKSGTLVHKYEYTDGSPAEELYKNVDIKVLEWIKGKNKSAKATYLELGGETATKVQKIQGVTPVNKGEEYLIFMNKYGAFLSPYTMLRVVNGKISIAPTSFDMLPAELRRKTPSGTQTISVESYIAAIRKHLDTQKK